MEKKLDTRLAVAFITAGNATFTFRNSETLNRFTYRVSIPEDKQPETTNIWFVGVLTGADNNSDYSYIGFIRRGVDGKLAFEWGKKSRVSADAPSVKAFSFVFNELLVNGFTKPNLEFWHAGKCCRCGRKLTDPVSIENGIGPECAKNIGKVVGKY